MIKSVIYMMAMSLSCGFTSACSQSETPNVPANATAAQEGRPGLPNFVSLARDLQPAVVSISALISENDWQQQPGETMEQLYGVPLPDSSATQHSLGSGFIIAADGVILTNAHVIEGAKRITVRLSDKREFEADVVGKDPHIDIALLRIACRESLPTLKLGDSDRLEVGEWVMAVGNPFGLNSSVSSGIVSAKGRHLGDAYDRPIQTDVNLNPGNSGGPLINLAGEVVGVSKAVVSQGGANLGIGFATPINLIREVLPELRSRGRVTRAWAGMAVQEITPALARTLGLEEPRGALVAGVVRDGPAERGGVRTGDVILELDGRKVADALDLPLWISRLPVDKRVPLKVRRDARELRLNMSLAALPEKSAGSDPERSH